MKSNLSITAPLSLPLLGSAATCILLPAPILSSQKKNFAIKAAASSSTNSPNPFTPHLKAAACAVIFSAATFWKLPAPALEKLPMPSESLTATIDTEQEEEDDSAENSHPLESSFDALKDLLEEKLEECEDGESLSILRKLSAAEPENEEWRFMAARLLTEMGRYEEAHGAFEEILSRNPLSFEALLENALVMDRWVEREAVFQRLSDALEVAEKEMKPREARGVKMIMAQMKFLEDMRFLEKEIKEMGEALRSYDVLAMEDPFDFRPYYCKAMLYSLMHYYDEADEQFAKYKALHTKQYEFEGGYPLTRMQPH
ncbi:protein SLOW GREEN 1, chloroplastic-like [Salvia divinorum]|uniref:Protein SLOW GREEN 1, chloroplastic-like n=1 Tax=Salvia divinorum TaxID=28513 RepID=A0ABD1GWU6_SALDI